MGSGVNVIRLLSSFFNKLISLIRPNKLECLLLESLFSLGTWLGVYLRREQRLVCLLLNKHTLIQAEAFFTKKSLLGAHYTSTSLANKEFYNVDKALATLSLTKRLNKLKHLTIEVFLS